MRSPISIVFCLTLIVSSSWSQSTQIQTSGGQGSVSGSLSLSGTPGRMVDLLLHPLRPFLGEAGHKALHNAIEVIPMSVLNQISTLGQLFGALITFNPTAVPQLISQFFPGVTSMFTSLIPSLGSAGLGALTSMATGGGLGSSRSGSSPLESFFRQNFPASQRENLGSSNLPSNRGLNAFNPSNIMSNLVGQGMSNFAGVSSSLSNGEPLSALLTMAGGAADTVGRFGNLASNGFNMAQQAAQTATGMASQLPGPIGQLSSNFASMIPGASASSNADGNGDSFSASTSTGSGSGRGRGSMFSSPLTNLISNNPFTAFLSG